MAESKLGAAYVAIRAKLDELDGDLQKARSKIEKGLGNTMQQVGKKLTGIGGKISAAVTLPLVAMGGAAIAAASDLNESMNKVDVVFGTSAGVIQEWSKSAASSFGLSRQEALEAVGTFGNLFTAMGMGTTPAAEMSQGLVQLAADLASFNNISPTEALEKLRSGLLGESEPLRSLGVNLNEAAVKAKAMEMGLASSTKELTPAMLAQARYALILEQTKAAQGDFARTSDGLANSQRILSAQFKDAAASLGTQLLPIALKVVQGLSKLAEKFSNLSPAAQKTILIFAGIAAAVGPVLVAIGSVVGAIGAIVTAFGAGGALAGVGAAIAGVVAAIAPVILPILAVIAVLGLLYLAWKNNWFGIRDFITALIPQIGAFLSQAWETIKQTAITAWTAISTFFTTTWTTIQTTATTIWTAISTFFTTTWTTIQTTATTIWAAISTFFTTTWTTIQAIATAIWTAISTFFTTTWTTIQTTATTIWAAISTFFTTTWTTIQTTVTTIWTAISTFFTTTWTTIQTTATTIWTAVSTFFTTIWTTIQTTATTIWTAISTFFTTTWTTIQTTTVEIWTTLQTRASEIWSGIKKTIADLLNSLISVAGNAGGAMIEAFKNSIVAKANAVLDAVRAIVAKIRALLPGSDAKTGPLSTLTAAGRALPATLAEGMSSGQSLVEEAARRMAQAMSLEMNLTPAAVPANPTGGAASTSQTVNVVINNPRGEPSETSITKQLRNMAYLGVLNPA